MLRIGIDTGGTFTDFVVVRDGRVTTWKEPSTPDDPARAILAGLKRAFGGGEGSGGAEVVHGSTVATNALLEGRTARVAFIGNRGFEDLIEIGRQARPDLYDLMVRRPDPLVPRSLRFGVSGRRLADGSELNPPDPAQLLDLAGRLGELQVEALAICFLHSYLDPSHEARAAELLAGSGAQITISSGLVREYREYERASTTVVNAAVGPVVSRYMSRLAGGLAGAGLKSLRVMGSNGGALSAEAAGREAVRTVLSGPAAGVRAALHVGRTIGCANLISFDMGGTSTDVSLIPGEARTVSDATVAGYPIRIPTIDIHTVGAGGGSIGWRDPGGALRVGPASAGAEPGPACYGRGGPATVTDAHLVLGRIVSERFLGGRMLLDAGAARDAVGGIADALGLPLERAAEGILQVAEAAMARAIRVISLYRGWEPSDFALIAFGGAGGLHAAALASALGMTHAIVPADAGVFSAFGMTTADIVRDRSGSLLRDAAGLAPSDLEGAFAPLETLCLQDLQSDGVEPSRAVLHRSMDLRYRGQSYELELPIAAGGADWAGRFHREHQRRYGYDRPEEPVEVVTLRVRGIGAVEPPPTPPLEPRGRSLVAALLGRARVVCDAASLDAAIYDRGLMPPGSGVEGRAGRGESTRGPALILDEGATTFVPAGWSAALDAYGHLHLEPDR